MVVHCFGGEGASQHVLDRARGWHRALRLAPYGVDADEWLKPRPGRRSATLRVRLGLRATSHASGSALCPRQGFRVPARALRGATSAPNLRFLQATGSRQLQARATRSETFVARPPRLPTAAAGIVVVPSFARVGFWRTPQRRARGSAAGRPSSQAASGDFRRWSDWENGILVAQRDRPTLAKPRRSDDDRARSGRARALDAVSDPRQSTSRCYDVCDATA